MVMTKALRQHIRSLKQRRSRWEHEQILVEGEKCIAELCKSDWSVERIYFTTPWEGADFWSGLEGATPDMATLVSSKDMEMMSAMKTPPGLLATAKPPKDFNSEFTTNDLTLFLDNVSDPGNVGTLIRVADWFGLSGVVVSPQSADPIGPKALQSAMGSTFHIPIVVRSFEDLPEEMKAHAIGLDAGGQDLFEGAFNSTPTLLVVGSESHGVSDDVKAGCHSMAAIPGAGRAESLNASVAGAIAVASIVQQRRTMR